MTGPAVPADDRLREALAGVSLAHRWAVVGTSEVGTDLYGCECGEVVADRAMEQHRVDALLPVVRAYGDLRAAEELRAAAARWTWLGGVRAVPSGELTARAVTLTARAEAGQ